MARRTLRDLPTSVSTGSFYICIFFLLFGMNKCEIMSPNEDLLLSSSVQRSLNNADEADNCQMDFFVFNVILGCDCQDSHKADHLLLKEN